MQNSEPSFLVSFEIVVDMRWQFSCYDTVFFFKLCVAHLDCYNVYGHNMKWLSIRWGGCKTTF